MLNAKKISNINIMMLIIVIILFILNIYKNVELIIVLIFISTNMLLNIILYHKIIEIENKLED